MVLLYFHFYHFDKELHQYEKYLLQYFYLLFISSCFFNNFIFLVLLTIINKPIAMTHKLTTLPVTIFIVNILESLEKVAIKATCNDKIDTAASAKLIFLSDCQIG